MTRRLGFLDACLPTRYDEGMTRTIRRYGNRKLYDVTESRYVTLAFLGERLRAGDDLAVVAHPAGTDITNETLANIVLAEIHGSRAYDRARLLDLIKASTQVATPPAPPAAPMPPTGP
jgi:polyhydroxyalkanoate synthesis regulator protein